MPFHGESILKPEQKMYVILLMASGLRELYVEQKPEIHEGVCQYFDLLAELTDIQTDENGNLYWEKI